MSSGWGSAVLEGYLEKHMKPFGKSKLWCSLRTSQLVTQKGPQKSGGGETYSLTDIQMVRKVSSDRSGLQFEIQVKNKTITFSASSGQDCDKWVDALHSALMSHQRSSRRLMSSPASSGYEEIDFDESLRRFASRSNSVSTTSEVETGYAQIEDIAQPRQTVTKRNSQAATAGGPQKGEEEDPYATVMEPGFQASSKSETVSAASHAADAASTPSPDPRGSLSPAELRDKEEELQKGYAIVDKKASMAFLESDQAKPASGSKEDEKTEVVVVNLRRPSIVQPNGGEEENEDAFRSSEDELDQWYEEAKPYLQTDFPPIPTFHKLTNDDVLPYTNLKEFFNRNPQLCRASYRISHSADPVADLRSLLTKLQ